MFSNLSNKQYRVLYYILFSCFMSGIVFIGIASSFPYMLSELGMKISKISLVFMATLPYSFKFFMAPFIKNIITKYFNSKFDIIKMMSFILQANILLLFALVGYYEIYNNTIIACAIILILTIFISLHDILCSHVKLISFDKNNMGIATAVTNTGFRLGAFVSGAGILYISNKYSWRAGFLITSLTILFATIATIWIPRMTPQFNSNEQYKSLMYYIGYLRKFFNRYTFIIMLVIIFSFKFSDSCINSLKPIFLQTRGVNKIDFVNAAHLTGMISLILGGAFAGYTTCRMRMESCIKASIIGQIIATLLFAYITIYEFDLTTLVIVSTISTFAFGYSTVILRTFLSLQSNSDVVIYTLLLSIGSLFRILSTYAGSFIVEHYSWIALDIICFLSNLPIFLIYKKLVLSK